MASISEVCPENGVLQAISKSSLAVGKQRQPIAQKIRHLPDSEMTASDGSDKKAEAMPAKPHRS
jgi:hypothetical protein